MNDLEVYSSAALLGAMAGMRSMSAPAVVGQLSRNGALDEVEGSLGLVRKSGFGLTFGILTLGEMVADKLPVTPNRTALGPLLGRALTGALSGAVICSAKKRSAWWGALIGASAAVGMAYAAYQLRKEAGEKTRIPDGVIALVEDAVVGSLGAALSSRLRLPAGA